MTTRGQGEDELPPRVRAAVMTGEVYCPIRTGSIALEACCALQVDRMPRCEELACPWRVCRGLFLAEVTRAKEGSLKSTPKQTGRAPKPKPARRRKEPTRRVWQTTTTT